jgi:TolB-like protein
VESYLDFIRSIDFIYHSQGVNRPLRQKDDDVIHSSNQPVYRDQINKAANAIKEILRGIENVQSALVKGQIDNLTLPDDIRTDDQYTVKPAGNKKGKIFYTSFSTILIIALIAFYLFTSGSKLPFSKRDWILITDFENLTDDPVFDKSLYTAFSLTVSQSRYINVFPRLSMIEVLARMEMPDSTFVDERIGREMATREGIAFCIIPTISNIGNKYAVGAKIMETQSGDLLRSEILFSQTRDEILPVLDQISKKIRLELGESRFSIFNQDKPLSKVTHPLLKR